MQREYVVRDDELKFAFDLEGEIFDIQPAPSAEFRAGGKPVHKWKLITRAPA